MTREELIEVMARAILRDYEDGADMSTHPVPERAATRHALAALAALEAAGLRLVPIEGWQPIETAPRDGHDILVYCQDTSEMFVGFSNPDEIAADPGIFFYALRTDGRRIGCRPHLWRPLPTPPATTQHEDTP